MIFFQREYPTFRPLRDKTWKVIPTANMVRKSLKTLIGSEKLRKLHWGYMEELASIWFDESIYQSPPTAFMYAYKNLVGTNIVLSELIKLREMGGNIIPLDYTVRDTAPKTAHSVFRTHNQGFRHYPKGGSTNILRAGVSTGKYNDTTQMEAVFYDTAVDYPGPKSVSQCRYLEALSEQLFQNSETGLILQIVAQLNFKRPNRSAREFSTSMVFSFCEVVPFSRWDDELVKRELEVYGHRLLFPMLLKPLSAHVAREKLGLIQDLGKEIDSQKDPYRIRAILLNSDMVKKWNYKSIQSKKPVRLELKEYIERHSPKCAHHDDTCTVSCKGMTDKNFHVGHIVSQSWAKSYRVFQESVHHPDNLYLSCESCNESLGKGGPSRRVLQYLNDNFLTIGDLVRTKMLT